MFVWTVESVAALIALVLAYWGALFLTQRSLLFPAPYAPGTPPPGVTQVVTLTAPGSSTYALYLAPATALSGPAPLLIFTHGNAELADDWVQPFSEPRSWGWAALLVEYPGYGRASGSTSERSITAAMDAAYQWARSNPEIDSDRIVVYGRSLGGAPAARLGAEQRVAAIILESSFTSVRSFAARYLAPTFLIRDPFDALGALARYRGPLLVLHGGRDDIVPVAHGRALAAAVPGAEFHQLSCGHNDCPRPWAIVRAFLAAHGLLR